jgi:hypothetical protein
VNLRWDEGNKEKYRYYREKGIFKDMTDSFFRVYRTIDGLKIALKKNQEVSSVDDLIKLRRYGEREEEDFESFVFYPDLGIFKVGRLELTREQILSLDWKEYTSVDKRRGKLVREKMAYMVLAPWMRIEIRPFVEGMRPPMIRFFLNGIVFAKQGVKFDISNYEFHSENWIDPYAEGFSFEAFMRMQEYFLRFLKENMPGMAKELWIAFFGRDEDLMVKVTHVELSYDSYIDKLRLVNALRLIGAKHKTMKYDAVQENEFTTWGKDIGLKYYLTMPKGIQLKVYSKAIHKTTGRVLNRFEITRNIRKSLLNFEAKDLFCKEVVETVKRVNVGLTNDEKLEEIKRLLRPYVSKRAENRLLHEVFLFDLFLHGQVKGRGIYKKIARIYAEQGLLEIQGRGRNSVYVLKPEFWCIHEEFRRLFGDIPLRILGDSTTTTTNDNDSRDSESL